MLARPTDIRMLWKMSLAATYGMINTRPVAEHTKTARMSPSFLGIL